jgi:hypothetical protein
MKTPANEAEEATGVVTAAAGSAEMPAEAATANTNRPLSLSLSKPNHRSTQFLYILSHVDPIAILKCKCIK